jgi:hypothetical protein
MTRSSQDLRRNHRSVVGAGVLGLIATVAVAAPNVVEFEIIRGIVITRQPVAARITTLGAAIYHSGEGYHMPVTVRLHLRTPDGVTTDLDPFGRFDCALSGNVNWQVEGSNLPNRPRRYTIRGMNPADLQITASARSWARIDPDSPSTTNADWEVFRERNSVRDQTFVKVLRNGDPVPRVPGFMGQDSVEDYVADYIDTATGTVRLRPNQVIVLFELGTNNTNAAACDYQDNVLVIDLADSHVGLVDQVD